MIDEVIAITPDGRRAVFKYKGNTLKVCDLETGEELKTLRGHSDWVNTVAITPDGLRAVSGSGDKTCKVWDLETGYIIASFTGESRITSTAVAPDARTIVAGSSSGSVHILKLVEVD
jgi:WD40 repeat protein